ncbi:hypothetical protein [uncultured Polaribacter sp.]|uniref:hypothetical protein n=1 Tax=uncultured Polaribacter sp. TaxID=174711 RepID=UPI0026271C9A|nr:hypothetical protein [uncultured Polaribacter sp.]
MSDNCLHIVPLHKEDYPNAELKAKEILEWFQKKGIVEKELSACILSKDKKGYRFKPNITSIFNEGELWAYRDKYCIYGLELVFEKRTVFHPQEGAYLVIDCPNCNKTIDEQLGYEWISDWYENKGKDYQNCPICKEKRHLTEYHIEPTWAFSNIGISLWNTHWDLKSDFLNEMKQLFGTEIIIVPVRI